MSSLTSYRLSTHAVLRALERTSLSAGSLLDRIERSGVVWLPARMPENHRHALVYCARTDSYIVAILQQTDRVVKTILTLEQWESMYWKVADIWLVLAQHAAGQHLLPEGVQGLSADTTPSSVESLTSSHIQEAKEESTPLQSLDLRLVVKLDSPKGPKYQTLLEKKQPQWEKILGSAPAERRRTQTGFLSKLARRLLNVNLFASEVRRKLERHRELVGQSDNLLLVFGPISYGVQFLPQVDVGKQLLVMLDKLEKKDKKLALERKRAEARKQLTWLGQNHPSLANSKMSSKNRSIFAILVKPNTISPAPVTEKKVEQDSVE